MSPIRGRYFIDACTVRDYRGAEVQLDAGIWNTFQGGTGMTSISVPNGREVLVPDADFAKMVLDGVARQMP